MHQLNLKSDMYNDLINIFCNLALRGYLRANSRSGRWLFEFGWSVVVGLGENFTLNQTTPNPTKNLFKRAHLQSPETKQRAMQRMVIFFETD